MFGQYEKTEIEIHKLKLEIECLENLIYELENEPSVIKYKIIINKKKSTLEN